MYHLFKKPHVLRYINLTLSYPLIISSQVFLGDLVLMGALNFEELPHRAGYQNSERYRWVLSTWVDDCTGDQEMYG